MVEELVDLCGVEMCGSAVSQLDGGVDELAHELEGKRVPAVGPVENDLRRQILALEDKMLEVHGAPVDSALRASLALWFTSRSPRGRGRRHTR